MLQDKQHTVVFLVYKKNYQKATIKNYSSVLTKK